MIGHPHRLDTAPKRVRDAAKQVSDMLPSGMWLVIQRASDDGFHAACQLNCHSVGFPAKLIESLPLGVKFDGESHFKVDRKKTKANKA